MKYAVFIEKYAQRQIRKFDQNAIVQIKSAILSLAENPRPPGYIKLKGENAFRIRVNQFRIIYEIDDSSITILIVAVGHRKDIYRKK